MMSKAYFGLALSACALNTANAIFGTLAVSGLGSLGAATVAGGGIGLTATAAGAATGSTVFLTATGVTVLGGALLLKGLAVAGLAASQGSRGKRSAVDSADDFAFATLAQSEPAQCYRRLICDLATGSMPKSENDVIMTLFKKPTAIDSPKFDFATAASIGKQARSVQLCELRYSCPLSTSDIQKLFN